jgi:hypothetical protein
LKTKSKIASVIGMFAITCSYAFPQVNFTTADSVIDFLTGNWTWEKYCGGWSGCTTEFDSPRIFCFDAIQGYDDSLTFKYFRGDTLFYSLNYNVSYSPVRMYNNEYYWTLKGEYDAWMIDFYNSDSIRMRTIAWDGLDILLSRGGTIEWINSIYPENINVFPNPSCGKFVIGYTGNKSLKVQLFDMTGACLMMGTIDGSSIEFDIGTLSNGIYIIEISGEDWYVEKKLIKE